MVSRRDADVIIQIHNYRWDAKVGNFCVKFWTKWPGFKRRESGQVKPSSFCPISVDETSGPDQFFHSYCKCFLHWLVVTSQATNRTRLLFVVAGLMTSLDDCKGRVVVSVKEDDQFASLPFEARVLEGSVFERYASLTFSCFTDFSTLGWNDSSTSFTLQYPKRSDDVINEDSSYLIRRNIELINSFDFPLLIHKIQSNHTDLNPLFQVFIWSSSNFILISSFRQVITSGESFLLPPLNLTTCFTIACAVSSARDVMNREGVTSLTRHIHVYTNASLFSIPVVLFTNHLQVLLIFKLPLVTTNRFSVQNKIRRWLR